MEAWAELYLFESIQRKTENRIEDLRGLIRATANLLPDDERRHELLLLDFFKHPTNITEAVRVALYLGKVKGERLTPLQIREQAESRGFNFSEYTNPMASVHTILRRMREADPPAVDYDEDTGTYLMVAAAPPVSQTIVGKITQQAYWKLYSGEFNEPLTKEKLALAMDQLTDEVLSEEFKKAERSRDKEAE
jgi:hypothetical protein